MSILVMVFEATFDCIPPPTRYLIVISLLGAKPYSWVWNTEATLKLLYKLEIPGTSPSPIVSGLGSIVLSDLLAIPAPNSSCNVLSDKKRDT